MDFEIEGDEDYDFADDWSKPKSGKSVFGGGGGNAEDPYDFDFGAAVSKKPSKYEPSRASTSVATNINQGGRRAGESAVSKSVNSLDRSEDALAKAQSMLNKYANKGPAASLSSKPKTIFNFDEDDISIDSDESSVLNKPSKKSKQTTNKASDFNIEESGSFESEGDLGGLDSGPAVFGSTVASKKPMERGGQAPAPSSSYANSKTTIDFEVSGSFEEEAPAYSPAGSPMDARPTGNSRPASSTADESIAEEPEEEGDISSEYSFEGFEEPAGKPAALNTKVSSAVPSIPQKPQIEENSNESNYSEDSYVSGAASDAEDVSEERPKMKLLSFADLDSIVVSEPQAQEPYTNLPATVEDPKRLPQKPAPSEAPSANVAPTSAASKAPVASSTTLSMQRPPPPVDEPSALSAVQDNNIGSIMRGAYHKIPVSTQSVDTASSQRSASGLSSSSSSLPLKPPVFSSSEPVQAQPLEQPQRHPAVSVPPTNQYHQTPHNPYYMAPGPSMAAASSDPAASQSTPPPMQYPGGGMFGVPGYPMTMPMMGMPMPPPYGMNPHMMAAAMMPQGGLGQPPFGYPGAVPGYFMNPYGGMMMPPPPAAMGMYGIRDSNASLGSIYANGMMPPHTATGTGRQSSSSAFLDNSVLEILKELKQAKEEAAEANRRLADVLLTINSDKISRSSAGATAAPAARSHHGVGSRSPPHTQRPSATKIAASDNSVEEIEEEHDEEDEEGYYDDDFEEGHSVIDQSMRKAPATKSPVKTASPKKSVKRAQTAASSSATNAATTPPGDNAPLPEISNHPQYVDPLLLSGWEQVLRERLLSTLGVPPAASRAAALPSDPMASALATSQALFRKQLQNLRERLDYTNASYAMRSADRSQGKQPYS